MLGVGDRGRGDNTSQYAQRRMFSCVCVCGEGLLVYNAMQAQAIISTLPDVNNKNSSKTLEVPHPHGWTRYTFGTRTGR